MKLTRGEKLILVALADADNDPLDRALDLRFIRNAITSGQTWAIDWESSAVPKEDTSPEVASETAEILGMWTVIERYVERLDPTDRKAAEDAAYPFDLQFEGFDGNHDDHFGVASFLIEDMRCFTEFKERALNSHSSSSLPHYRSMLPLYRALVRNKGWHEESWTAEEIATVVKGGWTSAEGT